jgi:hypothetical protein
MLEIKDRKKSYKDFIDSQVNEKQNLLFMETYKLNSKELMTNRRELEKAAAVGGAAGNIS